MGVVVIVMVVMVMVVVMVVIELVMVMVVSQFSCFRPGVLRTVQQPGGDD